MLVSYIIPCFNEQETTVELYRRLVGVADTRPELDFEFVFVNDGSSDKTEEILDTLSADDRRLSVVHFAKNRGHQIAATAGLDFCIGDIAIIMDADLQDPPELLDVFLDKIDEGFDIVHAKRNTRPGETRFKLISARMFYWLFRKLADQDIEENCGDFRAITKPVIQTIRQFREPHRFLRGMFALLGFRQAVVRYDRDVRYAGETKYPVHKMLKLAVNAGISFSGSPIGIVFSLAMVLWVGSLGYALMAIYQKFVLGITVPGWTSLVILLTFFTGLQLFALSVLGAYVRRVFEQGQDRPLYWVRRTSNIQLQDATHIKELELYRRVLAATTDPNH